MYGKYEAAYRILLAFMLIDNDIDEKEKKIVLEFLETKIGKALPKELQQISLHKDKMSFENFRDDAKVAYENFSRGELYDILDFIGKMIKSDGKIEDKEIMLFEILLEQWKIGKEAMSDLGIKKGLWSKFFG